MARQSVDIPREDWGCPGGALEKRLVWEGMVVYEPRKAGIRAQRTLDLKGHLRLAKRDILAGTRWVHYHNQRGLSNAGTIQGRNLV